MDTFLNHRYRLDSEIGQGAMGTVYRGYDVLLDRDVAVKVLRNTILDNQARARFLHEARAAAHLNHPNVVAVHDTGEARESPYIVMELVEGHTLHDQPPEALGDILACTVQICAGLEHAHTHGIVHRDLKPENVMLLADGSVKLMDFGLAHFTAGRHAAGGAVAGTPFYLAPEQALGLPVDGRTDLYALGVILYELVTGQLPFRGEDLLDVIAQHLYSAAVPPVVLNPGLPSDLNTLIVQLLSKDPAGRPVSAAETGRRLQEVLARNVPTSSIAEPVAVPAIGGAPFLRPGMPAGHHPTPFVARDRELQRLDNFLDQALRGEGQVALITGEAGAGKTLLATEFARRAAEEHPGLLAAAGTCNAFTGVGDAYLPFREILAMLTGELEAGWAAGFVSTATARQLWAALPLVLQSLVRYGQDLVGLLLPGPALQARLDPAGLPEADWTDRLRSLVSGRPGPQPELDQALIFEQVTRVLTSVAARRPLLLFLDDLQWADTASISLLYHLGRRLQSHAVLLVAAYRPDEVAMGRDGAPHPLAKILAELRRYGGDIIIDLDRAQERQGQYFVNALVDTEPNQLGSGFRKALYRLTGGHPLFTIELLRAMEDRGELVQDREGKYVATPLLDWARLPARVEGVVEERIRRLDDGLQQVMSVASVEGDRFTAQVVARVLGRDERELVRQLGQELAGRHHLVVAQGTERIEGQRLQRFRFRHGLYQWQLYHRLPDSERELLHEEVADVLRSLYGPSAGEIASQLAYHYSQAGTTDKAAYYLELAGNQARARYAVEEAISYYSQALALTPEAEQPLRFRLLLARQEGYDLQGDREAERRDLAVLAALGEELADPRKKVQVALRRSAWASRTGDYAGMAEYARQAVSWSRGTGDRDQEAEGYRLWGRSLVSLGDYDGAREYLSQALDLARAGGLDMLVAHTLRSLGEASYYSGDYAGARQYEEQAYAVYRTVGDRRAEGMALGDLGMVAGSLGDYEDAWQCYESALAAFREAGDQGGEAAMLSNLGHTLASQGQFAPASDYYRQALPGLHDVGARSGEAVTLCNIGLAALAQDDAVGAEESYERALALARETGERWIEGYAWTGLGQALLLKGWMEKAEDYLERAIVVRTDLGQESLLMESRAGLARVELHRGDLVAARAQVETILAYVDAGYDLGDTETPCVIFYICSRVLRAVGDSRARELLRRSYDWLQARAARLGDEESRRLFWQGVSWHRDIREDWLTTG